MKKKILINIHYLEIGGAERALIGLLQALDYSRVEVDLFINQHTGPLMEHIPSEVNLLPESRRWSQIEKPMTEVLRNGHIDIVVARCFAKVKHWLYQKSQPIAKDAEDASIFHYVASCVNPLMPPPAGDREYDLAISFLTPHHMVANKIRARKKLAWIHTDYTRAVVNSKAELPLWDKFDNIVSISPDVTKSFTNAFPSLSKKIVEIENILSPQFIHAQACQGTASEMNRGLHIKLLSVGRVCYQKNFECIPFIVQQLRARDLNVHWYVIGGYPTEEIISSIQQTNTSQYIYFLGCKDNPYPYIKECDIYVQPSRYEGKSVAIREAQVLCKPVVATAYPTVSSQIRNNEDGFIVPLDLVGCIEGLYKFITNRELQARLIKNLQSSDYGNMSEIHKIYELLND